MKYSEMIASQSSIVNKYDDHDFPHGGRAEYNATWVKMMEAHKTADTTDAPLRALEGLD